MMETQNLNGINVEALLDHLTREARQQYEAKTAELDKLCVRLEGLLDKYDPQEKEIIFDVKGVADYLHLAVQTIYTKVCHGEIPFFKNDRKKLRFKKSLIDDWNLGKKQLTSSDIDKQAENYILTH